MMETKNIIHTSLPKWPAMVVVGDSITPEQAELVIMRTDSLWTYFGCNDMDWLKALASAVDLTFDENEQWPNSNRWQEIKEQIKYLDLQYIHNDQIASAYIGGPNGWCHWDGTILQLDRNVGKWPSVEDILGDWSSVAQAFSFLNLRVQLYSGEHCEDHSEPIVQINVGNGQAEVMPGLDDIEKIQNSNMADIFLHLRKGIERERGCSLKKFRQAFKRASA